MKRISILVVVALVLTLAASLAVGATNDTIYVDGEHGVDEDNCGSGPSGDACKTIQYAISDVAEAGDTIEVAAGEYVEVGQIVIDKDLSIVGENMDTTIIKPDGDTGSSGDDRGWFLVGAGSEFNLSNVTLDGEGKNIHQAIRSYGTGTIENNIIENIRYSDTMGFGIAVFGNMVISNNMISNIQRVGISIFDMSLFLGGDPKATDVIVEGNTLIGKGPGGDVFGYGIEQDCGAKATISGNTFRNWGSDTADWASAGILVHDNFFAGVAAEATITGNTFEDNEYGLYVGDYGHAASVVTATNNVFENNQKRGVLRWAADEDVVPGVVGATYNWWGAASGPSGEGPGSGDSVSENVNYSPWWGDHEGSFDVEEGDDGEIVVPSETDVSEIQQIIGDAPYGAVIVLPAEVIEGSFTIATPGITIVLSDGTVIQPTSPCFVVAEDDITITSDSLGGVCQPSDGDPGIDVSTAVSGLVIKGIEIDGSNTSGDGIYINASVKDLQILDNYIHSCASGIHYTDNGEVSGVHEVQGNLFMDNTDFGVENLSGQLYDVTYNSWGEQDGPYGEGSETGDPVSDDLTFDPWTHVAVFMTSSGTPQDNQVATGYQITYTIQMDAYEVQGADFQLSFDDSALKVVSISDGGLFPLEARLTTVADANTHGIISFHGGRGLERTLSGAAQEVYTVVFEALSAGSSPVALELVQASFAMAPGYGGSNNIYPSELEDGEVTIHPATTVTGRIDLQGRADNSGAVMTFLEGPTLGYGPFVFDPSSYWGDISVGVAYDDTYTITVDMPRYLNVTITSTKSVEIGEEPVDLSTLVLFGGDVNGDHMIDIADAGAIGGAYGAVLDGAGWNPDADINDDGVIDILDLALMGGNFGLTSATAYDGWNP